MLVRAVVWMPRRLTQVKIAANKMTQTAKGGGRMFIAALLHQMVPMVGLRT